MAIRFMFAGIGHNALRAAALRGLLVFMFADRSHVHRPGLLYQPTAPALRLPACCTKSRPGIVPGTG